MAGSSSASPTAGLERLLEPTSIAIVGASANPTKLGSRTLANLINARFPGKLYPINPGTDEVLGLRAYPSVSALPELPDVAFLLIPADASLAALEECAARGIGMAIVAAGGFGEVGDVGRARQRRLTEIVQRSGIRVCGPNTNGLYNVRRRIPLGWNVSFSQPLPMGHVALVGHSGATLGALATHFLSQPLGMGLSYVVTTGAEVDIELCDVVDFLVADPATHAIGVLIEGVRDGPRFRACVDRAVAANKPVVALKLGKSTRGALAAQSHTGRMTGAAEVYEAVFAAHGAVSADSIETFLGALQLVTSQPSPGAGRILAIAASGGSAELLADRATHYGLPLATLSPELRGRLPPGGIAGSVISNPVDIGNLAQGASLEEVTILAADAGNDCVLTHMYGSQRDQQVRDFCDGAQAFDKLTAAIAGADVSPASIGIFAPYGIPVFNSIDTCLGSLAAVVRAARRGNVRRSDRHSGDAPAHLGVEAGTRQAACQLVAAGSRFLDEGRTKHLLSLYGLTCAATVVTADLSEARGAAANLGLPVILKAVTTRLTHKAEAGLVSEPVWRMDQFEGTYAHLQTNAASPADQSAGLVSVEAYVPHEFEMILGIKRDPTFGPVILCGLGGVFTEVLRDVGIALLPVDESDAWSLIRALDCWPILERAEARHTVRLAALVDAVLRVATLAEDCGDRIESLDVNPIVLLASGATVLDAKAELRYVE